MIYIYLYLLAFVMIIALALTMRRTWVCVVCSAIAFVMVLAPMGLIMYFFARLGDIGAIG